LGWSKVRLSNNGKVDSESREITQSTNLFCLLFRTVQTVSKTILIEALFDANLGNDLIAFPKIVKTNAGALEKAKICDVSKEGDWLDDNVCIYVWVSIPCSSTAFDTPGWRAHSRTFHFQGRLYLTTVSSCGRHGFLSKTTKISTRSGKGRGASNGSKSNDRDRELHGDVLQYARRGATQRHLLSVDLSRSYARNACPFGRQTALKNTSHVSKINIPIS
jgi:hypothetical protein